MKILVALGGNALARRGQKISYSEQDVNARVAMANIAKLAEKHDVVIVHGNGPQVGLLALQSEAYKDVPVYPLDVISAESQGMIGYLLQQRLQNLLPKRKVATVLTQTIVDANDPAFQNPTKFIGPVYNQQQVSELKAQHPDWQFRADGEYMRRVVPSPKPKDFVELDVINSLISQGVLTICVGGGGVPVTRDAQGVLKGIEAVVDKDAAGEVLASKLQVDAFIIMTDVENVYINWGKPDQKKLERVTISELNKYDFAAGSMGPKVAAAKNFVHNLSPQKRKTSFSAIGSLDKALDMASQKSGTIVVAD